MDPSHKVPEEAFFRAFKCNQLMHFIISCVGYV